MAYVNPNFKTKKALKAAIADGQKVTVWYPGIASKSPDNREFIEGPQYPEPHRWYAQVEVNENNEVIKVIS